MFAHCTMYIHRGIIYFLLFVMFIADLIKMFALYLLPLLFLLVLFFNVNESHLNFFDYAQDALKDKMSFVWILTFTASVIIGLTFRSLSIILERISYKLAVYSDNYLARIGYYY